MSSPSSSPVTTTRTELALMKRLFSMLDEVTLREVVIALDALAIELEHEVAEAAERRVRSNAVDYWKQALRQNTRCWADLANLTFLERYERLAPMLRSRGDLTQPKASKHHFRTTLEA